MIGNGFGASDVALQLQYLEAWIEREGREQGEWSR